LSEFLGGGKTLLVAEVAYEDGFKFLIIKVAFEVQDMNFATCFGVRLIQGRSSSEVQDGRKGATFENGVGGIDPGGRQDQLADVKICRGEPERSAEAVPLHHAASDRVGPPEQVAGGGELSLADATADSGAADGLLGSGDRGKGMDLETERTSEGTQQGHVTLAPVAEAKVDSHREAEQGGDLCCQVSNEVRGANLTERLVELDDDSGVEAQVPEDMESVGKRIDQRRGSIRSQDGVGMLVKGQRDGESVVWAAIPQRLLEDRLMTEVYSIEHAQSEGDPPQPGLKLTGLRDNEHVGRWQGLRRRR
jgi:hypothetical protein